MEYDWLKHPENPHLLIIMRGVSGSGKSYRANQLSDGDESVICSADYFFGKTTEEYVANWRAELLGTAHRVCQANVRDRMQKRAPLVIVDNTNTRLAEMMPYFDMAVQYDYRVEVHEPTSDLWVNGVVPYLPHSAKNAAELDVAAQKLYEINQTTHKVPLDVIKKQLRRFAYPVTFDTLAACHKRTTGA